VQRFVTWGTLAARSRRRSPRRSGHALCALLATCWRVVTLETALRAGGNVFGTPRREAGGVTGTHVTLFTLGVTGCREPEAVDVLCLSGR
jgi:hypothetical protein